VQSKIGFFAQLSTETMKILLIGLGKMGKVIEKTALARGHEIAYRIDADGVRELKKIKVANVDVAIEFTEPTSAFDNISWCIDHGVPVVSGTTGWLDKYAEICTKCEAKKGAFFYASNYSIGVNLFMHVNALVAELMNKYPSYDVEMQEIHHTEKKDKPSGTAITLANSLLEKIDSKTAWVNSEKCKPNEVSIISFRQDAVPGTHIVHYRSNDDSIELKHIAHSRNGFALGAVTAAEFIAGKTGVFGMKDLLGF